MVIPAFRAHLQGDEQEQSGEHGRIQPFIPRTAQTVGETQQNGRQTTEVEEAKAEGVVPAGSRLKAEEHHGEGQWRPCCQTEVLAPEVTGDVKEGVDPQSNPDRKGIEGPDVSVVPLPRLQRVLVQVNHDGQAGQHEQQPGHGEVLPATDRLEDQADEAEQ